MSDRKMVPMPGNLVGVIEIAFIDAPKQTGTSLIDQIISQKMSKCSLTRAHSRQVTAPRALNAVGGLVD